MRAQVWLNRRRRAMGRPASPADGSAMATAVSSRWRANCVLASGMERAWPKVRH